MRQAGEGLEGIKHGRHRQAHGVTERQRRQGVGLIVRAPHLQLAHRQQRLELIGQVFLAVFLEQAETLEVRFAETKAPAWHLVGDHRPRQRIVTVYHHLPRAAEDAVFGQVISRQIGVAIHMVFADVQAGGHFGVEQLGGFQLEAGEFDHVQLDIISQQIQRRGTEVAAHGNLAPSRCGHLADQGGHGALGVGAGDGDDRRLRFASEQVDIAGQFGATLGRFLQGRGGHGQAGTDQQLAGPGEEIHVQLATTHFDLRELFTQGAQLRRIGTGVDHGEAHALAREVAHQGHAALAEADNDAELVGSDQAHAVLNAVSK